MTTTTTGIEREDDYRIEDLETEAGAAGDTMMVAICRLALGGS